MSGKDIEPPQPGVSQRRKIITSLHREERGLFWKPVQREATGISQFSRRCSSIALPQFPNIKALAKPLKSQRHSYEVMPFNSAEKRK